MKTITTDELAVVIEIPSRWNNHKYTRYGKTNVALEEAITTAFPGFADIYSGTREQIIDALFVMRGPAIEALEAGGREIDKIGAAA